MLNDIELYSIYTNDINYEYIIPITIKASSLETFLMFNDVRVAHTSVHNWRPIYFENLKEKITNSEAKRLCISTLFKDYRYIA